MTYDAHNDPQHGPTAYVNPGEGPVPGGELMHAAINAECLLIDAFGADREKWRVERAPDLDEDGRYGFDLRGGDADWSIRVALPGLPIAQVRYTGADGQNPWSYPRVFIYHPSAPNWPDSWLWCYMVDAVRERVSAPTLPPAS